MAVKIEKYDSILEKLNNSGKHYWEVNQDEANYEVFSAYCDSKGHNRNVLDISGSFWPRDIPAMVEEMKAEGIAEFTISDSRCSIAEILTVFEDSGAKLQGLTRIKTGFDDFRTGEPEMKSAFLMKII
ncbi:MAG: hypothetical protein IJ697_06930 [Synergistaceae bacterium]|nr:hypothetical protein [Synergistaceae bacterium]